MRLVLDACVLYPTVLREILVGVAREGLITPLWSARILEEWARAAARRNPADEAVARGEIALLTAEFPSASVEVPAAAEVRLWLPDAADIHVLAAAVAGDAEAIVTLNLRDFPARELSASGIVAIHPDALLRGLWDRGAEPVTSIVAAVHAQAERLSGTELPLRGLLKRARLPRLARALTG